MIELNKIVLADCMNIMCDIPDKYFELAVVDPPYGTGNFIRGTAHGHKIIRKFKGPEKWNHEIPEKKYFNELERISQKQIIWGANYYNCFKTGGALIWYKGDGIDTISKCEIASLSFQKKIDYVSISWQAGFYRVKKEGIVIHPCQKPISLYVWVLQNYANPRDKIIDTHSGSGSCAIACFLEGFDFLAIEKDADYHAASVKRFDDIKSQGRMF